MGVSFPAHHSPIPRCARTGTEVHTPTNKEKKERKKERKEKSVM